MSLRTLNVASEPEFKGEINCFSTDCPFFYFLLM